MDRAAPRKPPPLIMKLLGTDKQQRSTQGVSPSCHNPRGVSVVGEAMDRAAPRKPPPLIMKLLGTDKQQRSTQG
ncbi:hypothetical protein PGTUg99_002843 [Puccinia graminis f. sp. tritici]|uniref:Uncharacterized protein n=1 Tax=Puccinia graminis f. sp. tritici TaxID=56615 RepID=A0A5B0S358_PUCGR|nr:hypothetical protein PGTUg99_002843 [Puccinia graminis f. sp. tritici]